MQARLTTLFADIREFTAASSVIPPDVMAGFIKEFADAVGKCISRRGGAPVRFLGDCVMGLFDLESGASEVAALRAATDLHELFVSLRSRWGERIPELAAVGIGFGVATGSVVAGTFGTEDLGEFSAIGEPVNRASRLQGVAADGEIVMCEMTLAAASGHLAFNAQRREVSLKGLGDVCAWSVRAVALARAMSGLPQAIKSDPAVADGQPPTIIIAPEIPPDLSSPAAPWAGRSSAAPSRK